MKPIDPLKIFTNLGGQELVLPDGTVLTYGQALANIFLGHRGKRLDLMKLFSLAQRAYAAKEPLEFDKSDASKIKEILNEDTTYSPIVIGPLLEHFQT